MSEPSNKSLSKDQVRVKRAVILVVSLLLLFIIGLSSVLLARHFDNQESRMLIYGIWEEQNVPSYAQEIFEVREEAVYVEQRIVDTRYTFDGSILIYSYEGQAYTYQVLDEHVTELQRITPARYETIFHVRGKIYPSEEESSEIASDN